MFVRKQRTGLWLPIGLWLLALAGGPSSGLGAAEEEPPAINPFGPAKQDRGDALPGYLELSDGTVYVGTIYMTRGKRLKMEDRQAGGDDVRQREVPLRVVKQIECLVDKEWMEKEWRFKEAALNEKVFTGRTYPARVYSHTVTLNDGRKISGTMGEIIYVRPFIASREGPLADNPLPDPERFMLHKRDKGDVGKDLKSLLYVKQIKLGEDAVDEGRKKAEKQAAKGQSKPKPTTSRKGAAKKPAKAVGCVLGTHPSG
jgi:hypothetical protein